MSLVAALPLPCRRRVPGGTRVGIAALLSIALAAVLASALAPYDPHAPSGTPIAAPSEQHRLGTNDLGQDLLSIWLHGARVSLTIGFLVGAFSTAASGAVGLLSVAWRAGRVPLLAITDGLLAIPHLPIMVLILALLGPGIAHLIAALALLSWPAYARVVRAQGLVAVQRDYVQAARALGATDARILRNCLLPEVFPLLWTKFLLTVRWAILMEAALALMGLGDSTQISWGTMLNSAFAYPLLFLGDAWLWWALPPALGIAVLALALSAIGQDFEGWLNPAAAGVRRTPPR